MTGVVYDRNENQTAKSFLSQQNELFKGGESGENYFGKNVLTVSIIISVSIIALLVLKSKTKKA